MKTKTMLKRGFTLVELLVVIAIIATLAGVGVPTIINQKKKAARSQAISNAKQIGLALFTFEEDYGTFPSSTTATAVKDNNPDSPLSFSGTTANDYFRQLIVAGVIDQEKPFYAKGAYTRPPDNVLNTSSNALVAGEVGFGYITGSAEQGALSSSKNSASPVCVASPLNAASDGTCDPEVYDKKAVVLRVDQSAVAESIRSDNKQVSVGGGKTLLQTGDDTVWGTDFTPTLNAPQK